METALPPAAGRGIMGMVAPATLLPPGGGASLTVAAVEGGAPGVVIFQVGPEAGAPVGAPIIIVGPGRGGLGAGILALLTEPERSHLVGATVAGAGRR